MTKRNLIAVLMFLVPLCTWAQDDVYFVPKKKAAQQERVATAVVREPEVQIVYTDGTTTSDIVGTARDVDEYNRRGGTTGTLVQQPDGTFAYQVAPGDTLGLMNDSLAALTRSYTDSGAYSEGYYDGYADGEDYAMTRRMSRFGYGSVYASPWYWSYYSDPWYWDTYWYGYDPYWYGGYYGWSRPYWGYYGYYGWRGYYGYYGYYDPYWYGYYGYGPYYGGHHYGNGFARRNTSYSSRYSNLRTADRNFSRGGRSGSGSATGVRRGGTLGDRGGSYIGRGSSTDRGTSTSTNRGNSSISTSRGSSSTTTSRSTPTYSGSSSSSSSSSSRSGSGGFGGVSRGSSGGGGGFSGGGGGSRGGGRGR